MQIKITQNPYEILNVDLSADMKAINNAFSKKSRGKDKILTRLAYDQLRKPEIRILIDAVTPPWLEKPALDSEQIVELQNLGENVELNTLLDFETIVRKDILVLLGLVADSFLRHLKPLEQPLNYNENFSGLKEFEERWLNQ